MGTCFVKRSLTHQYNNKNDTRYWTLINVKHSFSWSASNFTLKANVTNSVLFDISSIPKYTCHLSRKGCHSNPSGHQDSPCNTKEWVLYLGFYNSFHVLKEILMENLISWMVHGDICCPIVDMVFHLWSYLLSLYILVLLPCLCSHLFVKENHINYKCVM